MFPSRIWLRNGCRSFLFAACILIPFVASAQVRQATVYRTARGTTERISRVETLRFESLDQPEETIPTVMVDPGKPFQVIEGFGGALTDASAETYYKLPADKRKEIITALFDTTVGNAYTFNRTNIHSCDFSSDSYAYAETPGDTALNHFSIDHDRKYRIPFIKEAIQAAGGHMKLFGSPWSPPAWMKTNNNMLQGGKLKPEYRGTWARYYTQFIEAYEKEDIPIWGISVQNEPMATQTWESCIFTGDEERDFVRDHLGPTLHRTGLDRINVIVWDHNRNIMYQRAKAVYDDPKAAAYVWGTGFHWYVNDAFDNVRLVHDAWPDKKLLFTEGTEASFDSTRLDNWDSGETFGRSIINDLNHWANGWVHWNVILDETGGPNHVGNFCMAPIIADTRTGKVHYMNSHYYIGHFSRFIRPGARRIVASVSTDNLLATAAVNPDGTIAVVVMNPTERDVSYRVWMDRQAALTSLPAHSIVTLVL